MTVTSVVKDEDARTMTLTARFDAPVGRVWQVWGDPRQLERWWGPPAFPATVTEHDLTPGGTVAYTMTGPEGDRHRGWWRVRAVDPPHTLEFEDGFADADGNPRPDTPTGVIRVALSELAGGGTQMEITAAWASDEAMERILAMGTDAGMTAAVGQIDELLSLATYTFDVFCSLDGYGSYDSSGDWGGYWGKQGPEFLDRRLAMYGAEQRMVLGAITFRQFVEALGPSTEQSKVSDPVNTRMRDMPTTVVSTTLQGPLDWPNATLVSGDAVDVVARLKEESEVPLRSHGSLSLNRTLMAAGLVDRVQVTIFPVITGQTGTDPIFQGAADFDLELIESRTLDGHTQELVYRPTLHR